MMSSNSRRSSSVSWQITSTNSAGSGMSGRRSRGAVRLLVVMAFHLAPAVQTVMACRSVDEVLSMTTWRGLAFSATGIRNVRTPAS